MEESVERTDIFAGRITHLPAVEPRPAEAGQQIKGPLFDTAQSGTLGLEVACLQRVARLQKQLPSGLLHSLGNVGFQGFQGHPFRVYTDSDRGLYGRHSRLTSCPCGPGPTVSLLFCLTLGNYTTHPALEHRLDLFEDTE